MANQRKAGVERVTLTIPDELLRAAEAEAARRGTDRLAVIREALSLHLGQPSGIVAEAPKAYRAPASKSSKPAAKRSR